MASRAHQFMLKLLAGRMRQVGYEPIMYDGDSYEIGDIKLNMPVSIINHRPDLIGMNIHDELCIGEVKTKNDISSKRTKNQLIDFSKNQKLIICAPFSSKYEVLGRLHNLNLNLNPNIDYIFVPDELIPSDN